MIRALSPYYINTDLSPSGVTCEQFTLTIQIWDGDKASPEDTNEYKITYKNTSASAGSHKININAMIQDYVEFNVPTSFSVVAGTTIKMGNNQAWVYSFVQYDSSTTKFDEQTELMTLGYTYGDQGENYTAVTDDFLLPVMDYKINRDGVFIVPFLVDEVTDNDIEVSFDGGAAAFTNTISATTNSSNAVQYLWIDMVNDFPTAEQYMSVTWKGTTINFDIYEEARYTPMDIMFQNKDGGMQTFTFFKDRKEETTITDSIYESNRGQGSQGYHQFLRYNVQARNSVSASTGFIHERENEIVQQILYSRRTWIYDPAKSVYRAVIVKDTSKQFKTQLTERLINYTMKFEYGYNQINNI
tara:strand:+ start:1485 stop:2555 length:1071 start_codon:yes stop_codon:yes gene_type:complete